MSVIHTVGVVTVPVFIISVIIYGLFKHVQVYDAFISGASGALGLIAKIFPTLSAMVIATGLLRASGLLDALVNILSAPLSFLGIPPDIITLYVIRPFSGSGALSALVDILEASGADSLTSAIASTMMGSSETTIYTMALYFGAVNITKTRHTLFVALLCDFVTLLTAALVCKMFFG